MRLIDEEDVTCLMMMMMIDVHFMLNCDENSLINIFMFEAAVSLISVCLFEHSCTHIITIIAAAATAVRPSWLGEDWEVCGWRDGEGNV